LFNDDEGQCCEFSELYVTTNFIKAEEDPEIVLEKYEDDVEFRVEKYISYLKSIDVYNAFVNNLENNSSRNMDQHAELMPWKNFHDLFLMLLSGLTL